MQAGLYEADLGGGLLKKRIARPGQGKSGGYRTLVATNKGGSGFLYSAFRRMSGAISTRTRKKA